VVCPVLNGYIGQFIFLLFFERKSALFLFLHLFENFFFFFNSMKIITNLLLIYGIVFIIKKKNLSLQKLKF